MSEEVIETSDSAAPESAAPAVETTESSIDASPVGVDGTEIAPADGYTPNLKFKVMDEEKSIDDFLAPVMKDAETEKKIRELYEKAYGLDHVKPKYEDLKTTHQKTQQGYQQLQSDVQEILSYKNSGDLDMFFETVGLSEDKVAEWILEKAKKLNLPPDQRQVYDDYDKARRTNGDYNRKLQSLEAHNQQLAVQARTQELESVLTRPEVTSVSKNYDGARKQSGAFKNLVISIGESEFHRSGRDMSAEEATLQAMNLLGEAYRTASTGAESSGSAPLQRELPVIPRVGGKGVSPTGKQPRSIEDLRKLRSEMTGS